MNTSSFAIGDACGTPYQLNNSTMGTPTDYWISSSDSSVWLSLSAASTFVNFENTFVSSQQVKVIELSAYSGSCGNLTELFHNYYNYSTIDSGAFGTLVNLTIGSTYLIKVKVLGVLKNVSLKFENVIESEYQVLFPCATALPCAINGNNLLTNGNFESSPIPGGCTYNALTATIFTPIQHLCSGAFMASASRYAVYNNSITPFSYAGDHTSGAGNLLLIDPPTPPKISNAYNSTTTIVWEEDNVAVQPGYTYLFSLFSKSLDAYPLSAYNSSELEIMITNTSNGLIQSSAPFTVNSANWKETKFCFDPGQNSVVNVTIYATSYSAPIGSGSAPQCDFGLDDIYLGLASINKCCTAPSLILNSNTAYNLATVVAGLSFGAEILVHSGTTLNVPSGTNVSINSLHFFFENGSSIQVLPGATLNLNGAHLQGCGELWSGIILQSGATLTTTANTFIEDALAAVQALNGSTYTIQSTIFNKNYKGVFALNSSAQNGSIYNSIFTCRDISHGTTVAALKANNYLATLPSKTIIDPNYPIANGLSRSGVEVTNVITANTNGVSPIYNINVGEPSQSSSNANVFDNLKFGVYTSGSNIQIRNNIFQNITLGWSNGIFYGSAIYGIAVPSNGMGVCDIRVGGPFDNEKNTYYKVGYGVQLKNYRSMILQKNQFTTSATAASNTPGLVGLYGILLQTNSNSSNKCYINCQYNTISNYNVGLSWNRLSNSKIEADFSWNTINAVSGNSSSLFCNKAMDFSSLISQSDIPDSYISVSRNNISQVRNGILVQGFQNRFYLTNALFNTFEIHENTAIGLKYSPISSSIYSAIKLTSCQYIAIHDNNNIYSASYANANMRGIYLDGSSSCKVTCNTVHHIGRCFAFINNCDMQGGGTATNYGGLLNNTMGGTQTGISLETNALIGDQGWSGGASDNKWVGNYGPIGNAATNISVNIPNFWVRNTSPQIYNPYTTAFIPSIIANPSSLSCINNGLNEEQFLAAESINEEELKRLIGDSKYNPVLDDETKWIDKQKAYELLLKDSILSNTNDSTIINFRDSIQNENIGTIAEIRELLLQNMTIQAEALRMSMIAYNVMESNYDIFFENYIRYLSDSTIERDSVKATHLIAALLPVAQQCPNQGGAAVIEARALLTYLSNNVYDFEMDCNVEPGSYRKLFSSKPNNSILKAKRNNYFTISPNPGKELFTLKYTISKESEFVIFDLLGNPVYRITLDEKSNSISTNLSFLKPSCYYYSLYCDKKTISSNKLIIIK